MQTKFTLFLGSNSISDGLCIWYRDVYISYMLSTIIRNGTASLSNFMYCYIYTYTCTITFMMTKTVAQTTP